MHGALGKAQLTLLCCLLYCYYAISFAVSRFQCQHSPFRAAKSQVPTEKWKLLANGLQVASLVRNIEAKDTASMLQELIFQWVGKTTGNQWIMLIEAVRMCNEISVAQQPSAAVGVKYPPCSGTTIDRTFTH